MKLNRNELLTCLNAVKPGLAAKEVVEQSTSFVFQGDQAITYNDQIAIHAALPEGFEIEGAVPAKELLNILNRFKGDEVEFTPEENELRLKSGKQKAGIRLDAQITLPLDELKIPKNWSRLPKDFIAGIKTAAPSAARDMTDPVSTNLHITDQFIESTDNYRITRYTWQGKHQIKSPILLPAETAGILSRLNFTQFNQKDGWLHLTDGSGMIFSCRVSDGGFHDLDQFLEMDVVGELEFPSNMEEMLDRAGVFLSSTMEQDNTVHLTISGKGLLTIRGEGEYGWYEETCRAKWNGEETNFSIHPVHLQSILQDLKSAELGEDRIRFMTDQFIHVVALEVE